jgi:uncharacterized membrane protein
MPVKLKTKVTLLRIAAVLYALAGGLALVAASEDRPRARIAQAVLWFSLCIVFLSIARIKRKANQSEQYDSSNKSQ